MQERPRGFDGLIESSLGAWQRNPSIMLPAVFNAALEVVRQGAVILPLLVLLSQLSSQGILRRVSESLSSPNALDATLRAVFSPEVITMLVPTIVVAALLYSAVSVAGAGFILSMEFGSYNFLMERGSVTLTDVLREALGRWKSVAKTFVIVNLLIFGPVSVVVGWEIISILMRGLQAGMPTALEIVVFIALVAIAGLFGLLMAFLTIYAFPAVVFDGDSGLDAVRRSFGVMSRIPGKSLTYILVRIGFFLAITSIGLTSNVLGLTISTLLSTAAAFLLLPVLHLTKMQIYREARFEERGEGREWNVWGVLSWRSVWEAAVSKVRLGLGEARNYAISIGSVSYHLLSVGTFLAGYLWGAQVSSSGLGELIAASGYEVGRINPEFQRIFPLALGVEITFNNWQVSLATALAGLGGMIPALIGLLFNGFLLGVVGQLVPDSVMFAAAIAPHGSIEIPAFLLAGSVGLRLGLRSILLILRRVDVSAMISDVRQGIYVVIGLAPIFLVAGLVEATITPYLMRIYGWMI